LLDSISFFQLRNQSDNPKGQPFDVQIPFVKILEHSIKIFLICLPTLLEKSGPKPLGPGAEFSFKSITTL